MSSSNQLEPVPGREREGVMVVVPALAGGDDGDPPAVRRVVGRLVGPVAEHMRGAVDQPGEVIAQTSRTKMPHTTHGRPPNAKKPDGERELQGKREVREGPVERIGVEVWGVTLDLVLVGIATFGGRANLCAPIENRTGCPAVPFDVGIRVVLAVHRDPANRIALQRERPAYREEVFERFGHAQAAMRENAMVAERDAEHAGAVRENREHDEIGEAEERGTNAARASRRITIKPIPVARLDAS